jgi:signal transduction histidine kinase
MFEIQGYSRSEGDNSTGNSRLQESSLNPFSRTIAFHTSVLNGMSHEMRTQMNAIVSFAFLLKDNSIKEPEREDFINQIYIKCEQLIALFENYLESAIVDTGISKNEESSCCLNDLLDNLFSEFRDNLRKGGRNSIELVSEMQFSDSKEVIIDKTRVTRILRCLFNNSIQNTDSGYIKIGYYLGESNVTFYVLDSGQGFSKTKEFFHTNNLTDSLSQYPDLTSAVNITLAKKLIQFLHGSFDIRSNGTDGTGIHFSIPVTSHAKSDITINKYVNSMISI